jgi:hypothetical protein
VFLLYPLQFLVISLSKSNQTLFNSVYLRRVTLMLLRQLIVILLLIHVDLSLHQQFLGQPLRRLFKGGLFKVKPQVEEVAELVVLENIHYRVVIVSLFHDT